MENWLKKARTIDDLLLGDEHKAALDWVRERPDKAFVLLALNPDSGLEFKLVGDITYERLNWTGDQLKRMALGDL